MWENTGYAGIRRGCNIRSLERMPPAVLDDDGRDHVRLTTEQAVFANQKEGKHC